MTGTTSVTTSLGGGTIIVPPQSESGIFGENFNPADPIHGSIWFPDSSGIKTYAGNRVDAAIAHRDVVLDDLSVKLEQLNAELVGVGAIAPISASLDEAVLNYIPSGFERQTAPVRPTIPEDFPAAPADAVLGAVSDLVIDDVPILTAAEPTIGTISAPAKFVKEAPVATPLPDRVNPDKPAYTLPTAPTARILTLPTAPSITIADFAGVLPTALAAPPNAEFSFTEAEYQSMLNDELKTKLLSLVLNTAQTGLNPAIEQQIWDRGRERTTAVMREAVDNETKQWSRSGWNLPQGDEARNIRRLREQKREADITESRNIAATQADLEQKNFQFAFTQALALEGQLMNLHNNVQQRAFESAKYAVQALIDLYQIQATYFNAGVTLYTAQAQVYRDRIQAELTKLEVYKAELEGQKLIGELNGQDVANYRAQIEAVVAVFGLYKDELDAVKVQLEGDGLKVQQFEANIRAYAEEIHAKSLEYEGYKTELSGEELKATIYSALVGAFGKRVDAFNSVTDAKVKKLDADIKINIDTPLKVLQQNTEVFKSRVQAKATQIEGLTAIYKADADVFGTEVSAEAGRVNSGISLMKADLDFQSKKVDVQIEVFKANLSTLLAQKELLIKGLESEAGLLAQTAASIGGAVHFGASISGSSSYDNAGPTSVTF